MPEHERRRAFSRCGSDCAVRPAAAHDTAEFREWILALEAGISNGSFVKLSISHYNPSPESRGDASTHRKGAVREDGLKGIQARRVIVKHEEKLSFTYRYKTRDIVKNTGVEEGIRTIEQAFEDGFSTGALFTTSFDLIYERLASGRDRLHKTAATHATVPPLTHDRQKKRLISGLEKPYLHALGIVDAKGAVSKKAQDKYRQINRYVELLDPLIADDMLKVVDMGSGKGYLTFALYDYMTTVRGMAPQIVGVEQRDDLVTLCNAIAVESGFDGLRFVQGTIGDYDAAGVNVLIALHACDTATDDALAKGIAAGADLIVVAPCCHKQIRREMEKAGTRNERDFLLRHGIFMERQAEMVTDGIRALILESRGYLTKVFEFISGEHTAKNAMIVGRKSPQVHAGDPAVLENIREAKARFGIATHYLETVLQSFPLSP